MVTSEKNKSNYSEFSKYWDLDLNTVYLNHGAFGACPVPVLEKQSEYRHEIEKQPVRFMVRILPDLLENARRILADFVGTNLNNLAFIPCATHGVNTVLKSLKLNEGDELITTDHEYFACKNALDFVAKQQKAKVVIANIPFPVQSSDVIVKEVISKITPKTKILLIDYITSPTGLILPIKKILDELKKFSIDTILDGAHTPGMIPLNIDELDVAYFTGNCHKWLCTPKGSAFLYVRPDKQDYIHPLSLSYVLNGLYESGQSQFQKEFYWNGTYDPTPYLCIPESINYFKSLLTNGWDELRLKNRTLVLKARDIICNILEIDKPCPDDMIGSMASFPLPSSKLMPPFNELNIELLQDKLYSDYKIEVPVSFWPQSPNRVIRISAQLYNSIQQYEYFAESLKNILKNE